MEMKMTRLNRKNWNAMEKLKKRSKNKRKVVNRKFSEFLNSAKSLSAAMKLMEEWNIANNTELGVLCTNNHYEEELEREWRKDRQRLYGKKSKGKKCKKKK